MKLSKTIHMVKHTLKKNSPAILSTVAIGGLGSTVYLASKASIQAADVIRHDEKVSGTIEDPKERVKARVMTVWRLYIPAGVSGALTVGCIIASTHTSARRAAAANAAFVLSERAYNEYRNKIIEEYGARKDQTIRDEIAEDKIRRDAPEPNVLIAGPGNVLCCELMTGRYFACDMESLRRAENDLNARLIGQDVCSLDDFYYLIKLSSTSYSSDVGWNSDKLMKLEFSTVLTEDGRPCLAFEYNYTKPIYEGIFE